MGAPITKELPNDFPYITQNSPTQAVRFLEITGDGLVHRVLIENGSVEYFPNIGYGNFGEKTIMENAPYFKEGLDVTRLFFADLDGTGTADFIYMEPEKKTSGVKSFWYILLIIILLIGLVLAFSQRLIVA